MKAQHGIGVLVLVALVGSVDGLGCSSSAASGGTGASSRDTFSDRYAEALCDEAIPCCAAGSWYHDAETCKEVKAYTYRTLYARDSAKHFDASAADQCLEQIRIQAQTCGSHAPEVCLRVFYGDTTPGEPCSYFSDCAPPAGGYATCYSHDICEAHVPAALGEACGHDAASHSFAECDFDITLYCDPVVNTCQKRRALGEACAPDHEQCAEGAYCTAQGVCAAKLAAGEACVTGACRHGFCNANTKTCTNGGPDVCYVPP